MDVTLGCAPSPLLSPALHTAEEFARYRLVGALFRDQYPARQVQRDPDAPDKAQHDDRDPDQHGVEAEVARDSGCDPRQHPVLDWPPERRWRGGPDIRFPGRRRTTLGRS